jgi:hypothetical protein
MPVASLIYLTSEGKVLLLKRAKGNEVGSWGLVGGHIDAGETSAQCAVRELYEETGLKVNAISEAEGRIEDIDIYRLDVPMFEVKLNEEHTEFMWADPDKMPEGLHSGLGTLNLVLSMSKRVQDRNGWFEIADNPISKVGVFEYTGGSLGDPDADPMKIYKVYRPEEELNNPETINSFKLVPFTDDHPEDMMSIGAGEARVDDKPVEGVIGERVWFDQATKMLRGNLKLFTERVTSAIKEGKREVSAGYRCMYEKAKGVYNGEPYDYIQRKIRGNHASLVLEGRAGHDVRVLDHLKLTFDSKDIIMENAENGTAKDEMTLAEITEVIKKIGPQIAMLTEAMAGLGKPSESVDVEEVAEDMEEEKTLDEEVEAMAEDEEPKAMDAILKRVKALEAKSKGLDSKDVIRSLEQRNELYNGVSKITGAFVHNGMDAHDIAKYAVGKLGLNVPKGAEIVAVESYLAATNKQSNVVVLDTKPSNSAISKFVKGA